MWTLIHEILPPKLYELIINTELNGDTTLYVKNFYNHINMCINAMDSLWEDLLPAYQSIKRYSEFEEYCVSYHDHPYYYWNSWTYTSMVKSLLSTLTNDKCLKASTDPQSYKVVNIHSNEISGSKILNRLLHSHSPNIGGMSCDVLSDLSTLALRKG